MTSATVSEPKRAIALELWMLAAAALFFELATIRWMSSDLRSIAVLKTFPLVSCFVGLGCGYAQKDDRMFKWTPLMLLCFASLMKLNDFLGLNQLPYPTNAIYQWGIAHFSHDIVVAIVVFMVWLVALLAFPFLVMMGFGARLGQLFNSMKPLRAYSIDIVGSIVGSILFSLLSFLCAPPWLLLVLPAVALSVWAVGQHKLRLPAFIPAALALAVAAVPTHNDNNVVWTPYFRLEATPIVGTRDNKPVDLGVFIKVNQMFQQYFFPQWNPQGVAMAPDVAKTLRIRQHYYNVPYFFKQEPQDVLVLGCGTGQDVLAAVQHGAKHVDAVEIDPQVIKYGHKLNPAFNQPNVQIFNTDARNYTSNCHRKYDLVVFACLDSLAVTGMGSSVRIDSFVHTKESLAKTLSLLKPDGVLVMSFGAGGHHWLRDRLFSTLQLAGGYAPLYFTDENSPEHWPAFIYVAGQGVQNHTLKPISAIPNFEQQELSFNPSSHILTDDWPYLYSSPQPFDVPFGLLVAEILGLSLFAARKLIFAEKQSPSLWQMSFLGAAFLLLELQSISRLSLVFGATWLTSSLVINGVLVMILFANLVVSKWGERISMNVAFGGLFASLLLSYFLPVSALLDSGMGSLGAAIVVLPTLLPMFMAGIVFASAFKRQENSAKALGFNLFGAVIGAMLELLSTMTGVNALVLIALGLYFAAFLCERRTAPQVVPSVNLAG